MADTTTRTELPLIRAIHVVIGASLLLASACGSAAPPAATPSPSAPTSATPVDAVGTEPSAPEPPPAPTKAEQRLMRHFIAFARERTAESASRLPWADELAIGLGRDIKDTLDQTEAKDPAAWVLRAETFRGYTGPFSALERIRRHAETVSSDTAGGSGAFRISAGEHPHCASPPVSAPKEFKDYRRVSIQPADSSIDSCLDWFTVDLFLDERGRVAAVTLDLWEP